MVVKKRSRKKVSKKLYAVDGVDVKEEATFSSYAGSVCKSSYSNSNFVKIIDLSKGGFRGPRPFKLRGLPKNYILEASTDGIGTKGVLTDAAQSHEKSAYDLVAMTSSDITRFGGLPLVLVNILDTVSVGKDGDRVSKTYKKLIKGLGKVAKESKIVLLKGETAQMGTSISSEIKDSKTKFNWGATMIGAYHKDKMIIGNKLKKGQVVVALKENGFRCNGISSVRKALSMRYGEEWWKNSKAKKDIKKAAEPSVLYDNFINTLHGWHSKNFKPEIPIYGIIHLSGGAIREKFAKDLLFPRKLSAELPNLWGPPEIMKKCADWRGISDEEFYEAWNGGQGMLLIIDKKDANYCLKRAKDFGIKAIISGNITKEKTPTITIKSKLSGKTVVYR